MQINNIVVEKGNPPTDLVVNRGLCIPVEDLELPSDGEVYVTLNFTRSEPPIGTAKVYKKNGWLYADFAIYVQHENLLLLYPAVTVVSRPEVGPPAKMHYKLEQISLCSSGNADQTIMSLADQQTKNNEDTTK